MGAFDRPGYDWTLLDGDPTPGDPPVVSATATALRARSAEGMAVGAQLDAVGMAASGSGWAGRTTNAFLDAWSGLIPPLLAHSDAFNGAANAAAAWAVALRGLQAECDRLYAQAVDNDRVLQDALAALPEAEAATAAARHAVKVARTAADPVALSTAVRHLERVTATEQAVRSRLAESKAEAALLRTAAADLSAEHRQTGTGHALAVGDLRSPGFDLPAFSVAVAQDLIGQAIPLSRVDLDGNGTLDPAELAAAIAEVLHDGIGDPANGEVVAGLAGIGLILST